MTAVRSLGRTQYSVTCIFMRIVLLVAKSNFSFATSVRLRGTTHEITGVMVHRLPANRLQLVKKTQGYIQDQTKIIV